MMTGCGAAGGGGGGGTTNGDGGNGGDSNNGLTADPGMSQQTVSLTVGRQATVQLDAGASSTSNGQIVGYQWLDRYCGEIATGATAEVLLPVGQHNLTLVVTDSIGAEAESDFVVTVADDRPAEVALTTAVEGAGRTDPPAGAATGHALDSTATVTAMAEAGWQFIRWEGDSDAATASIALVMDGDKLLTAVFQEMPLGGVPRFYLPWGFGETRTTGQANDGEFSHQYPQEEGGGPRYAWDYTVQIGTPVLAVGAGRVVQVVDDIPNNPEGSVPDDPKVEANLVQIDHGNGLQSLYAHLDQFEVAVEPGQFVVGGQYLGLSGNSGYTTGPHLHYETMDPTSRSVSTGFFESLRQDGIAEEGDAVTSQNVLDSSSLDEYVESTMPTDAFVENNIELFEPTPPTFFFNAGQTYTVSGRVTDLARNVCVALVLPASANPDGIDETVFCDAQAVDRDDTFTIDFTFPTELAGSYLLGVVSGVGPPAGIARVNAVVLPPQPENEPPVVTVTQPEEDAIDFGQTGVLEATGSDPDGDALTYLWAQVSGPPATIAEPTSPQTEFTLDTGRGPTRVAFQVIASDGVETSPPVEVEYQMPDNFLVRDMAVTDIECSNRDQCTAAATDTLSAWRDQITVWVELLNLDEGDLSSFEIRDPAGEVVLSGRLCEPAEDSLGESFWLFGWTGHGVSSQAGDWRAVYLRNGVEEASTVFTLQP